jgi:hypothetical protein
MILRHVQTYLQCQGTYCSLLAPFDVDRGLGPGEEDDLAGKVDHGKVIFQGRSCGTAECALHDPVSG